MAAMVWSQRARGVGPVGGDARQLHAQQCKAVSEQMEDQGVREHVVLEASGGIVFDDLKSWHECGLDVVSTSVIIAALHARHGMLVKGL